MRAALAGLTTRGRCFVAAGLAAVACGLILGERDLLRVGIFVLALPLLGVAVVARTRYRVSCVRRLDPARVPVGHELRVRLSVSNVSRLPTGLLLVEDQVPYTVGSRPRFVLDRVEPHGARELTYRIRPDVRGRFRIGPLSVRLADPFGLVELGRSFTATDTLVVTPVVTPLPRVRLTGDWSGSGESHARAVSTAGEDDVATREYRHGDDLRRVHWPSTAHRGELMVRREEQHWQSQGAILLDTRRVAHRGDGPGSSFEWAVSAAASIGAHLAHSGFGLRLLTDGGQAVTGSDGARGGMLEGVLLDTLALVSTSRNPSLGDGVAALRRERAEGLVVAVLGVLDEAEVERLAQFRHGEATRVAVLVDTVTWGTSSPELLERAARDHDACVRRLRQGGWRVLPVQSGDDLAAIWSLLAQRGSRRREPSRAGGTR